MSTAQPDSTQVCLREDRDGVAVLTLNRPDRLNAWCPELEDAYFEQLIACEADEAVRAVVVTGAGKGFCAGADMDLLSGINSQDRPPAGSGLGRVRPVHFPLTLRTPLIAAINGAAAGVGLVQALYADVRFATPRAKLVTSFAHRGLIGEYGITWLLPRLVGSAHAADLLLSSRVVTGEEGHRMGLVNFVAEDALAAAVDYASSLATHSSPRSMAVLKQQLLTDPVRPFDEVVEDAVRLMAESFTAPDVKEGVASYLEGRAPQFPPLTPTKE